MQHKFWITKQTLSQKFGRKEDKCIVSSDAELDAKLELFRNIQMSCTILQRIINKYQETICYLSQETSSLGRFLKENSENKVQTKDTMLTAGKTLILCAQQQLILHEPLMRFYQELETFRQRAIEDTFQNINTMEKARTEFRATLLWMKNVSQELDPDTTKQLERFKKVQHQVKRKKQKFDKLALDCLQKIDLLAAARCNMFNYILNFYQNRIKNCYSESNNIYSTISKNYRQIEDVQEHACDEISILKINDIQDDDDSSTKKSSFADSVSKVKTDELLNGYLGKLSKNQCLNNLVTPERNYQLPRNSSELSYNDLIENVLVDNADPANIQNFNVDINEQIIFPSDLLHCSSNPVDYVSKTTDETSVPDNSNNLSIKREQTNTWLDLFDDLSPLSKDATVMAKKCEGSFV